MRRLRTLLAIAMMAPLVAVAAPSPPAGALHQGGGGADFAFDITAPLPKFPCTACFTSVNGVAHGGGTAVAATPATIAEFTVLGGTVTGTNIGYVEDPLTCPAHGSATGRVTVTASGNKVSGLVADETHFNTGVVRSITATIDFHYQRVGLAATIVVTGGSLKVNYRFPGDIADRTFTRPFTPVVGGAGAAVFDVDPIVAAQRCAAPAALTVRVRGDLALTMADT